MLKFSNISGYGGFSSLNKYIDWLKKKLKIISAWPTCFQMERKHGQLDCVIGLKKQLALHHVEWCTRNSENISLAKRNRISNPPGLHVFR